MCYLVLGWILTSWFMFCCQFWGHCRKYQISSWQQNTSLKNSLTGNATGREAILFPTSIQSKCLYQLICELTGFAGNFSPRICQIFHWGKIQSNPGKCWLFWPYDIIIGSGPSASFSNYGLSNSGRGPLFVLEIRGQTDQLNIK